MNINIVTVPEVLINMSSPLTNILKSKKEIYDQEDPTSSIIEWFFLLPATL